MKKIVNVKSTVKIILASVAFCGALLNPISGMAAESGSVCSSITATGNPEYPPFLWQQEQTGQLRGAVANLMGKLSEKINIPIKTIYVGPWSRSQQEVKSGRVDLMAGAFYTSERADYMAYFAPAMMFTKSMVWQSSRRKFDYQKWSDLRNNWGVTVINNSFGQDFDDYAKKNLSLLTVASLEQAFSMLDAGRADYVLYERSPGVAYVRHMSLEGLVEAVEPSISSEGLFLTISKLSPCNTPELRSRITTALRELVDEGVPQDVLVNALAEWSSKTR
ncbi:substrate-binding periplasmic protein [Marinomonas gallaica]|uniref:substrate-binding periplasmic protein n=1 Tax=Marinomonas gallaica TaxID=1806667 RepID=UPI003CE54575